MPNFGDILPNASGRSHIGVDGGIAVGSFDESTIRPFGHIIGISGVLVDPILGQSGVMRYSQKDEVFQLSPNGGVNFGIHFGGLDGKILLKDKLTVAIGRLTELINEDYYLGVGNDLSMAVSGELNLNVADNISLSVFNASGALTYRFGPHQAWYWKPTYGGTGGPFGDGYFPIPHSGQIEEMIVDSQQISYDGGREINQEDAGEAGRGNPASTTNGILHKYARNDQVQLDTFRKESNNIYAPITREPVNYGVSVSGYTPFTTANNIQDGHHINQTHPISMLGANYFIYKRFWVIQWKWQYG